MTCLVGLLPTSSVGIPWMDGFGMKYVNYAILVVPIALILLTIYWHVSVKHWFTGPATTLEAPKTPDGQAEPQPAP